VLIRHQHPILWRMWTQQGSIMVLWFAAMGLLLSGLVLA